jgi:hypothetical protein
MLVNDGCTLLIVIILVVGVRADTESLDDPVVELTISAVVSATFLKSLPVI